MKTVVLEKRKFHIVQTGAMGPEIYWGIGPGEEQEVDALISRLLKMKPDAEFTLIAYEAKEWNVDFSPWYVPSIDGMRGFEGGGGETARWLTKICIPYVQEKNMAFGRKYLTGYSLAGLFSLWQFYESGMFQGVACCSGTLWFEGWKSYAEHAAAPSDSFVYLSLGGKEERASNPVMASIGALTRWQNCILDRDTHILAHKLEWNSGGHFADSIKRVAKGIMWLLEQEEKYKIEHYRQ